MQPYIAAILVMLIPALSGCMPNAVSYYRPSVEGGKTLVMCRLYGLTRAGSRVCNLPAKQQRLHSPAFRRAGQ